MSVRLRFRFVCDHCAGFHHPFDFVDGDIDVGERIAFDGDYVGKIAGGDGAEFPLFPKHFGVVWSWRRAGLGGLPPATNDFENVHVSDETAFLLSPAPDLSVCASRSGFTLTGAAVRNRIRFILGVGRNTSCPTFPAPTFAPLSK